MAKEAAEEAERVKNEAQEKVAAMQAILQQLDEEARAALESMQDRDRAEAAQASSAQVRRAYAYNIPSVPIPANGSVVDYALSRIGCPYVWGAEGPETFDCSGLVRWAYLQVGISLPHQTESLYYAAAAQLPVENAQPGDVLWIGYGDGYNGHVAIACNEGGTHYVHAPRSAPSYATPTRCPGRASPTHCASRKGRGCMRLAKGSALAERAALRESRLLRVSRENLQHQLQTVPSGNGFCLRNRGTSRSGSVNTSISSPCSG